MKKILLALALVLSLGACGGSTGTSQDPAPDPNFTPQQRLNKLLSEGINISVPTFTEYAKDTFTIHSFSLTDQAEVEQAVALTLNADGTFSTFVAPPLFEYNSRVYTAESEFGPNSCVETLAPEGSLLYSPPDKGFSLFDLKVTWEVEETGFNPIFKIKREGTFYPHCFAGCDENECQFDLSPHQEVNTKSYVIEHADDTGFVIQTDQFYILMMK